MSNSLTPPLFEGERGSWNGISQWDMETGRFLE